MPDRILVVDDSVSMRQIMSLILEQAGFIADTAENGQKALEILNSEHKLAILDYNMPGMNGVELLKIIRNGTINKAIPALMVTTETEDYKKQDAKAAGATGWITKPFDSDALVAVIKKLTTAPKF